MRVHKYEVPFQKEFSIAIPGGIDAEILDAQFKGDRFFLWVFVHPEAKPKSRRFLVLDTGADTEYDLADLRYIATAQQGEMVRHLFEVDPLPF